MVYEEGIKGEEVIDTDTEEREVEDNYEKLSNTLWGDIS